MINAILRKTKWPPRTSFSSGEYDVTCEEIVIRLDPYDFDYYRITYLPDTREVAVLYNNECVHSVLLEQL